MKRTKRSPWSTKPAGKKAISLETTPLMTEKIIRWEKDRAESRKDSTRPGQVSAVAEGGQGDCADFEHHELFVWDHNANARCGGFVAAAMKRSRGDDEEAGDDGLASGGPPSQSVRVDDVGGKGGSRKGKGKADLECFLCGQEGHFKAHSSKRWYVPKTQWSSWWNSLPFQKGKVKGKGEKTRAMEASARTSSSARVMSKAWVGCSGVPRPGAVLVGGILERRR